MAADPLTKSTVDYLFNDDFSDFGDDPFADKPATNTRDDKPTLSPRAALKRKVDDKENDHFDLGVDEQIKTIKKPRKPVVKLDEARLLSEPGIPKLRTISRANQLSKKLRLKGKGHEFTDTARLLNHFQLWLDNLYPRAKFADALQLVEKAGHTKRMHITRSEWINEGKPGYKVYEPLGDTSAQQPAEPDLFSAELKQPTNTAVSNGTHLSRTGVADDLDDDALFIPDANRPAERDLDNDPDDDELDALLAAQDDSGSRSSDLRGNVRADESEGEDDLDALLAEQDAQRDYAASRPMPRPAPSNVQDEEDDLDALLAEQESHSVVGNDPTDDLPREKGTSSLQRGVESEDEDDDLGNVLAARRTKNQSTPVLPDTEPSLPTPQATSPTSQSPPMSRAQKTKTPTPTRERATIFSSSPIPNNPEEVDLDDLDALLASQEAKEIAIAATQTVARDRGSVTPKARRPREVSNDLLSSSPVPNDEESQ